MTNTVTNANGNIFIPAINTKKQLRDRLKEIMLTIIEKNGETEINANDRETVFKNLIVVAKELTGKKVVVVEEKGEGWVPEINPESTAQDIRAQDETDKFISKSFRIYYDLSCNKGTAEIFNEAFASNQKSPYSYGGNKPSFHAGAVDAFRSALLKVHQFYYKSTGIFPLQQDFDYFVKLREKLVHDIQQIPQPERNQSHVKGGETVTRERDNEIIFNRLNTQLFILDKVWYWIDYRNNEAAVYLSLFDSHFAAASSSSLTSLLPPRVQLLTGTALSSEAFPARKLEKIPEQGSDIPDDYEEVQMNQIAGDPAVPVNEEKK